MLVLILGLGTGCIYGLIAIGYSLMYKTTGVVDFSQGAYVVVGGITSYWYLTHVGMPYYLAVVVGVLTAAAAGLVLGLFVLAPLRWRRVPRFVLLLATIVYANMVTGLIQTVFGTSPVILRPWLGTFNIPYRGGVIAGQYVLVAIATAGMCLLIGYVLKQTMLGRGMRACGADGDVAELLGVSVPRMRLLASAVTAGVSGLAGAVIAPVSLMSYDEVLSYGLYGVTGAVLGGFGSLWGGFTGGMALGLLYAVVGRYLSSGYQDVIVFGLLLLVLIVRPRGILGVGVEIAHE